MSPGSGSTSRRAWACLLLLVFGYLLLDVLGGANGSPLVPALPAGVRPPGWTTAGAHALGLNRLGVRGLVLVCLFVLLVLIGAFAGVVAEALRGALGLRAVVLAAGLSLAVSVAGPLMLSRDVASYAVYGRMISVHDSNPYEHSPADIPSDPFTPVVSSEWLHTRSVYGPAFTLASAGLAGAWSGSPGATIQAFKALAGLACWFAVLLVASACRAVRPDRAPLAAAALGLNPVIVVHTVGGGHNDAVLAMLFAGALLLSLRARRRPSPAVTALLTLAVLVKAVGAIPLAVWLFWVARQSWPRRLRELAVHIGVATALVVALTAPVFAGWRTVTAMLNLASRQGWASGARLLARGAEAVGRVLGGHGVAVTLRTATYSVFLAVVALVVWRYLSRRGLARVADAWGASLLLFALAAPYLLPWYAAWFLPFLALMEDQFLVRIGLACGALLALTGVPTEPFPDPALWRDSVFAVHYVLAPVMLVLFVLAGRRAIESPQEPSNAP